MPGRGLYIGELAEWLSCTYWQSATLIAAILPVCSFILLIACRPIKRIKVLFGALGFLAVIGLVFVLASSLLQIFLAFELLLLTSLYLLRLTAKSDRVLEAATEMFFWTLVGSLGLFVGFILMYLEGVIGGGERQVGFYISTLITSLLVLGFGVKLPIWPCFSWLLKAHVEASVEFSILLSGIIVKFGVLGLQRVLQWSDSV
jgi:formate hydrogenlyase subunit 3/multisubunit Na+/H+ antiporter MnhD subunit